MGDSVEQTLGTIARVEAQLKPRISPSNVSEVDLLRQLDETKRLLHGFKPAVEAHQPVRRELYRAVVQMEAMARDHWWKHNGPEAKWREHFLESLLDVRWWTMVAALQEREEFAGVEIGFLTRDKSASSYHRHFPSYEFEKTAEGRNIFGEGGDIEAIIGAGLSKFALVGMTASSVHEAASPLINEELTLDLTQDVLGVSRTGSWVIRTTYQGVDCALKRVISGYRPVYARLSHPNIVHLMHYWWKEKYLFLMMELMDGDLTDVLKKGSLLSLPVAVDILLQTAKGMLYLHDMGVSYPSLSCANVLFRDENLLQDGRIGYIIKLAGGESMESDFRLNGKTRDVHRFGSLCLEVLNGRPQRDDSSDNIVLNIPEGTPQILRFCITSCFESNLSFGFEQVVTLLLLAKCQVLKGGKDEAVGSQGCETVQLGLDCAGASSTDADFQEYPLYQLYPEPDVSNPSTTLIFFHGFAKSPDEWKSTWMTRNREHVWPEAWLPKDLAQVNVRILSLSYDTDASEGGEDVGAVEIAKKVLRQLLSSKWNLADPEAKVVLIGHSFGGLVIKRLIVEAYNQATIQFENFESCEQFLGNLEGIVFYSVPGSATDQSQQFEEYITKLNETGVLRRSSLMQALLKDRRSFNQEMQVLSSIFENCVPEETRILHFIEGKGMKKIFGKQVVVSDASARARLKNVVFHVLKEDNHFEVCRPVSKDHKGYKILVEEFLKDIVFELETGGREYHQLEDVPHVCDSTKLAEEKKVAEAAEAERLAADKKRAAEGILLIEARARRQAEALGLADEEQERIKEIYETATTKALSTLFEVFETSSTEKEATTRVRPYTLELQQRAVMAEKALREKEEDNILLRQKLQHYDQQWVEYKAKMSAMEEMFQKQISSLQLSLEAAKKSMASEESALQTSPKNSPLNPRAISAKQSRATRPLLPTDEEEFEWDGEAASDPAKSPLQNSSRFSQAGSEYASGQGEVAAGRFYVTKMVREYDHRWQVYTDDLDFLVEVKSGQTQAHLNPEEELRNLKARFDGWKKDFKVRLRETKVVLSKLGNPDTTMERAKDKLGKKWWSKRLPSYT